MGSTTAGSNMSASEKSYRAATRSPKWSSGTAELWQTRPAGSKWIGAAGHATG